MAWLRELCNTRVYWRLLALALWVILFIYCFVIRVERVTITVLETSDLHGSITSYDYLYDEATQDTGLVRIASFVREQRRRYENLLLVDCGDALYGNMLPLLEDAGVQPMIEAMNLLGYDIWNLGNHEFQKDFSLLQTAVDLFDGDVLIGNAYHADGYGMEGTSAYAIREIEGVKVGIFGIAPPHIPGWESSRPDRYDNMFFLSPMEQTRIMVSVLRERVDVLIGLVHYGLNGEYGEAGMREVAEAYPQVDAFLLGHAHEVINEVVGKGTVVLEPGNAGRYVSKLTITLEKAGDKYRITDKSGENIFMAGYTPDMEMSAWYEALDEQLQTLSNRIIGWADGSFLPSKEVCGQLTSRFSRALMASKLSAAQLSDTALLDLFNDVQRYYTGADISMTMLPSPDVNIVPGVLSVRDVWILYPGDGTLMAAEVSGAQLRTIMESYAGSYFATYESSSISVHEKPLISFDRFCAFSGVKYEVDISREYGERIAVRTMEDQPIEDEDVFLLALPKVRYLELIRSGLIQETALRFDAQTDLPGAPSMRELIISYVEGMLQGQLSPSCDENWRLTIS